MNKYDVPGYGCTARAGQPCTGCAERWAKRQIYLVKFAVEIFSQNPDIPSEECARMAKEVCDHIDDHAGDFEAFRIADHRFYSHAQLAAHPEIAHGRPPGSRLH